MMLIVTKSCRVVRVANTGNKSDRVTTGELRPSVDCYIGVVDGQRQDVTYKLTDRGLTLHNRRCKRSAFNPLMHDSYFQCGEFCC